jgi:hypothetical protein
MSAASATPMSRASAGRSEGVKVDLVEHTLERLLETSGKPIVLADRAAGKEEVIAPAIAAARDGLLPVFLLAGEAVWREATGRDFGIEVVPDREALLGYRAARIARGPFTAVMLSVMEATWQAEGPMAVVVNELGAVWRDTLERAAAANRAAAPSEDAPEASPRPGVGLS